MWLTRHYHIAGTSSHNKVLQLWAAHVHIRACTRENHRSKLGVLLSDTPPFFFFFETVSPLNP